MSGLTHAIGPYALSAVHLVLALGVTGNVLLHRREASSSIVWIAFAWLAPLFGSLLYLLLGINRVSRRAIYPRRHQQYGRTTARCPGEQRDHQLAQLERAGQHITSRAVEGGNAIAVLYSGDDAYPRMLAAIEAAQSTVGMSTYLFRGDSAGQSFVDALARASARGVTVRVLIDGIGSGYFLSTASRLLRRAGVSVAQFLHSPLPWRMPFLNLRNHRKILCVDGRTAFVGGLNVGGENLLKQQPLRPVIDTHFMVEGPVVTQVVGVFLGDWLFATGERLAGGTWCPSVAASGDSEARAVTSGPDQDMGNLEFMILEAIGCARVSVKIMTPYFLPDERVMTALALASFRGVEVSLVLPERSNHRTLDWAARAHLTPLLAAGCLVWTHPAPFDHSKLMTVDGLWCLIGSANWDIRSLRLNFELDLEVYHPALVSVLDAMIVARQIHPITEAALDARSLPTRLRDSAARLLLPYL